MKIEINDLEEKKIILSDGQLDNYNFVDVIIDDIEVTVSVTELLAAVKAFDIKRKKELDVNKLL